MSLVCADLATKDELTAAVSSLQAEIQTLRDEINALLGPPEEEGLGTMNVLGLGSLAGTALYAGLTKDFEFIIDPITKKGKVFSKLPNGELREWGKAGKFLGETSAKAVAGAKGAAGAMGIVAQLALEIVNLGFIIEVRTRLKEAEAWQQANKFALNLYDQELGNMTNIIAKYHSDLSKAVTELDNLGAELEKSEADNKIQGETIENQQFHIDSLVDNLDTQTNNIKGLKKANQDLNKELDDLENYSIKEVTTLKSNIKLLEKNLTTSEENTEKMKEVAKKLGKEVATLKGSQTELKDRFTRMAFQQTFNHLETKNLITDLAADADVTTAKSKTPASLTQIFIQKTKKTGTSSGGGIAAGVSNSITNQQNIITSILSKMAGDPATVEDSGTGTSVTVNTNATYFDIVNGESNFETVSKELLKSVPDLTTFTGDSVTPTELDDWGTGFRENIKEDYAAVLAAVGFAGMPDKINDIQKNTTPEAIANAAETGICNSATSPGGCMKKSIVDPLKNNFGNIKDALGIGVDGLTLASNLKILEKVDKTQEFLSKAWNSTIVDKAINWMNTALIIHNGIMLSGNIGETMGDAISAVLSAANIKNAEDEDINVNEIISDKLQETLKSWLGTEAYTTLTNKLATANRIYQAGQNIIDDVTDLVDGTHQIMEETGGNVGKIGNALREAGEVDFDAYSEMREEVKATSKVFKRLEVTEETTDKIYSIISTVKDTKETGESLLENREEFKEELDKFLEESKEKEDENESKIESLEE